MIKQPSGNNCFVCGRNNDFSLKMEFYFDDNGDVISHVVIPERYEGYPGIVHGGVIAAMLDEASGRAYSDEPDRFFMTSELNVRYRKPVKVNTPITVKASKVNQKGRVAFAKAEIRDDAGILLAESNGVFVELSKEKVQEMDPEVFGWRVYPDEE
ncbi:MAG: PaaI family thioesterase [Anaerolineaceae bacterium]